MLVGIETKSVSELYHDNHVHEENDKTMQDLFSSLETPMRNAFYQLVQSLRQRSLAQNSGVKNDNDGVYANNPFQHCNENAFLHSASLSQQTPFISSSPLIATATSKQLCTHASTLTNLGPDKTVTVEIHSRSHRQCSSLEQRLLLCHRRLGPHRPPPGYQQ